MGQLVIATIISIIAYAITARATSSARTTGADARSHPTRTISKAHVSEAAPPGKPRARARLSYPPDPFPSWWLAQAVCVHEHEGAWNANTGNGYYGGLQFTDYTWRRALALLHRSYGPAHTETPRHQLEAAYVIWDDDGHSWREWGTASLCGLR